MNRNNGASPLEKKVPAAILCNDLRSLALSLIIDQPSNAMQLRDWALVLYCIACVGLLIKLTTNERSGTVAPTINHDDERFLEGRDEIEHALRMMHTTVRPMISRIMRATAARATCSAFVLALVSHLSTIIFHEYFELHASIIIITSKFRLSSRLIYYH